MNFHHHHHHIALFDRRGEPSQEAAVRRIEAHAAGKYI